MKVYILSTSTRISPFGDDVAESMVGNRTLAETQQLVLQGAGLQVERISSPSEIRENAFFLTYDDVFFTRRVMNAFVARAKREGCSLQVGLPAASLFVRRTQALQGLPAGEGDGEELVLYRLFFLQVASAPRTDEELHECLRAARPVRARFKEKVLRMPSPPHISGFHHYEHPVTSSVVIHIRNWVHILWANQFSIQIRWVETVLDHKAWTAWKLLCSGVVALFTGRWSRHGFLWTLVGRTNRKGRNCFVHPTATVEGCLLGNNVRVGAYALVRGCVLGDNVVIEDRANVYFSVVGPDCFISKNSTMVFCAGYPDSDLCVNGIQTCLFGRKCALTSRVWVIDLPAAGEIRVLHEGEYRPVGTKPLGACFGHGVFAGLDVTIGAGREVPNGAVIIRPPGDILRTIPPDLPPGVPAWAEDGVAVTARDHAKKD